MKLSALSGVKSRPLWEMSITRGHKMPGLQGTPIHQTNEFPVHKGLDIDAAHTNNVCVPVIHDFVYFGEIAEHGVEGLEMATETQRMVGI